MNDEQAHPPADPGAEPRLRLRSLKVHQFREVKPGTSLTFGEGFHLILGKNASGKSTLLSLLAAVSALDFRAPFFADTPLHIESSLTFGEMSIHVELKRSGEAGLAALPATDKWDIAVLVEHPALQGCRRVRARTGEDALVVSEEPGGLGERPLVALRGFEPQKLGLLAMLSLALGDPDPRNFAYVRPPFSAFLERQAEKGGLTSVPFDEALGMMQRMASEKAHATRGEKLLDTSRWFPASLDFKAQGEPLALDLSRDPVLADAIRKLGFDAATAYFGPGASRADGGWTYSSPAFQFFRGGKAARRHDQLSFGQQRLFSFAWYLACNPDVIIADELVNGLHSEWIDWCVDVMRDRQCFLTSQNPLLVDAISFATEEDLRRGITLCSAEPDPAGEEYLLSWRQLDDREVEILSRALQDERLDLLSDLLLALDLW